MSNHELSTHDVSTTYLSCFLDRPGDIEPASLLGSFLLRGDEGSIYEENVFLDTFFAALIEALRLVASGQSGYVDTIDEPNGLTVAPCEGGIELAYSEQWAIFHDPNRLAGEIRTQVGALLRAADAASARRGLPPEPFEALRRF